MVTQAIFGVTVGSENVIRITFPTVGSTGPGKALGQIFESIPLKINGIKLSYIIFSPLYPLLAVIYLLQKVFGEKYVLTNRAVQKWKTIGSAMIEEIPLGDFEEITIVSQSGQKFYNAADMEFLAANGNLLFKIEGVGRPEVFYHTIMEARDARYSVEASLANIQARAGS